MTTLIASENMKGGVGKTTVAVALADAIARAGSSAVASDTDPQGSLLRWLTLAEQRGQPVPVRGVGLPVIDLRHQLTGQLRGEDVAVIDGPPPGNPKLSDATIDAADLLVVPTAPEPAVIDRLPATLDAARRYSTPAVVVLVMVSGLVTDADQARAELERAGIQVLKTEMPQTVLITRNYGWRPSGPLALFGRNLWTEITQLGRTA